MHGNIPRAAMGGSSVRRASKVEGEETEHNQGTHAHQPQQNEDVNYKIVELIQKYHVHIIKQYSTVRCLQWLQEMDLIIKQVI